MALYAPLHYQNMIKTVLAFMLFTAMLIYPNRDLQAQNYNTETIAVKKDQANILKYVITKDTDDTQLDLMQKGLSQIGITVEVKKVKRNSRNEITSIKIKYTTKKESGSHVLKANRPIEPFEISVNTVTQAIEIYKSNSSLSQTLQIKDQESIETANDTVTYDAENNINGKNKQRLLVSPEFPEKINNYDPDRTPLILLDGKATAYNDIINIDPETIAAVIVLKDKNAIDKYGKEGENGVILISTKIKETEEKLNPPRHTNPKNNFLEPKNTESILYLLNAKEITYEEMILIDSGQITSIEIIKDKKAIEKYGSKAKDGVINISVKEE